MDGMMNNPMAQSLMQTLAQDPELMQWMQRPENMAKFQAIMANPALLTTYMQQDPEFAQFFGRMASMLPGDVAGQMSQGGGGGMGGMGDSDNMTPWSTQGSSSRAHAPTSSNSLHPPTVISIRNHNDFQAQLKTATESKKLLAVDFNTTWCRPCQLAKPVWNECSGSYTSNMIFLSVDGDLNREWIMPLGVTSFPTFKFYLDGNCVETLVGWNESRLRSFLSEYDEKITQESREKYRHFPIKENEVAKFNDIKWDVVELKCPDTNSKCPTENALSPTELDQLVQICTFFKQVKGNASVLTDSNFKALEKCFTHWPIESLGAALHILRLAILQSQSCAQYFAKQMSAYKDDTEGSRQQILTNNSTSLKNITSFHLIGRLFSIISSTLQNNAQSEKSKAVLLLLVYRTIANMFARHGLKVTLQHFFEECLDLSLRTVNAFEDDPLRSAVLAVLLNYCESFQSTSVSQSSRAAQYESEKMQFLTSLNEILMTSYNGFKETLQYRLLVILGSLCYEDATMQSFAKDFEMFPLIKSFNESAKDENIKQCTEELLKLLSN